jgi:iron complex outermembrane recepter protein
MIKHNELVRSIRYALYLGLAGAVATPAMAQEESDDTTDLGAVVVTGSRIKRVDAETASPVVAIDREAISASGLQTVGEILGRLTQSDSLGLTNVTSDTNANDGTQTISLRGLGASRTLVLVNGRRWLSLGNGTVDTTSIPASMIERVEVLTDGASAIYGSDAVGGVVNFILRESYEGAEAEVYYGEYTKGDGARTTATFTVGHTGEKGNASFSVTNTEIDPIFAGDREISRDVQFGVPQAFGSSFGPFGIFSIPRSALGLTGTGNTTVTLDPARAGAAGPRVASDFVPFTNAARYNFAPTNYLQTPSDRLSAYFQGNYEFNESIRFFSQFNFTQRKSVTQIAEVPLTINASGPQWAFPYAANSVYNPFGVQLNSTIGYRMVAAGPRTNIQDYDTFGGLVGFDGVFDLFDRSFSWDVFYQRAEDTRGSIGLNYVNLFNLRQGIGPSFRDAAGIARCGTSTAVIAGCVPVDLFNGPAGLTRDMINYITYTLNSGSTNALRNFGANLSGPIVALPAGDLGFALGVESRTNSLAVTQDSLVAAGGSSNNFNENTSGNVNVEEFYLELAIPVLADVPFAERLEFNVAGRQSDYTNTGRVGSVGQSRDFDSDSYKYGFTWKPINDVLVRGNYADTFRAPAVTNLYGGGAEGFNAATDPCSNAAFLANPFGALSPEQRARCLSQGVPATGATQLTGQIRTLSGGNPLLNPESGRTLTAGIVYSPEWLEGFDVSVDWYNIKLKDGLAGRSANSILNGCIRNGVVEDCSFITRDSAGTVQTIRLGQFNLAQLEVEGIDANFNYRLGTENWGNFAFGLNNSYTTKSDAGGGDQIGQAEGIFGDATWRLRSNLNVAWNYGDWTVNYGARYFSQLVETCGGAGLFAAGLATFELCTDPNRRFNNAAAPRNRLGATTYHDLSAAWRAPWDATIRVTATNVFGKEPPLSTTTFANSFIDSYDIPGGGFLAISYNQKF